MAFFILTCWYRAYRSRQAHLIKRTVLAFFFSLLFLSSSSFACVVSCRVSLNLSIGTDGFSVVTPNILLVDNSCDPADFRVEILDPFGFNLGDTITCAMVGQTLTAKVIKISNGNSCTTQITVNDNLNPIIGIPDTTLLCGQNYDPAVIGFPTVEDNCTTLSISDLSYVDVPMDYSCDFVDNGDTLNAIIERRWSATDEFGNTGMHSQFIRLKKSYLSDVQLPPNLNDTQFPAIDCNADPLDLNLTGFPNIDGLALNASNFCDLAADFSDQTLNICGAGYLILRTWTLADWCTGDVNSHVQLIKVRDTMPPTMVCPQDLTISTDVWTCNAVVNLPTTTAEDDCSTVTINPVWEFGTGYGPFNEVPLGTYPVTYTATDACGNNSTCVVMVTVEDQIAPQNICKSFLQVSLNFDGMAYVPALSFDAGTYDNCILGEFVVSRNGVDYESNAVFSCLDVENSPVVVTLRAYDFFGNYNECDIEVTVVDLLPPTISCPDSITLSCSQDYLDLSITGNPITFDNCEIDTVFFLDSLDLNTCNVGEIIRTWTVRDIGGVEVHCDQVINLVDTTELTIIFPDNYSTSVCNPDLSPEFTGEPIVGNKDCEFLYIGFTDDTTYQAFPACFVVHRHWEIFDWCSYNDQTNEGYWESSQVLSVVDNVDPVLMVPNDTTVYSLSENCGPAFFELNIPVATDCSNQISIINFSPFALVNNENASGNYPVGEHIISYQAEDNCGNTATASMTLTVLDGKAPSPVCKSGLIINLEANGQITVDADHVNLASFDNCTADSLLTFVLVPNTFTCSDVGVNQVELTVIDEAGNSAFCTTTITIQNNPGDCPDASISGTINLWSGAAINNVEMELNGLQASTNSSGQFEFNNLVPGQNYLLETFKNGNDDNGISILDLVLLSRVLIGLTSVNPYQLLAGDIDRDNTITVFDLIQMQRLILKVDTLVPNSNSWRFVPSDFVFTNPSNPFLDFPPEFHEINNLNLGTTVTDFIGMKLGDVSGNADASFSVVANGDLGIKAIEEIRKEESLENAIIFDKSAFRLKHDISTFGFQFVFECEKNLENVEVLFDKDLPFVTDQYYNKQTGELRIVGFHHESAAMSADSQLFKVNVNGREMKDLKASKSLMVDKNGYLLKIPVKFSNGF